MYELQVETEFAAAHAIVIAGKREALHGHNWRVCATVRGERLDNDGLLCDFHLVERHLREIVSRFHNRNLNETAPFDACNPTAEHVARHIAQELARSLADSLPMGVSVASVGVTEAPGCRAVHHLPISASAHESAMS